MCKIMGKEFQQYLPIVMGPVLKAASLKPEVALLDSECSLMSVRKHWQWNNVLKLWAWILKEIDILITAILIAAAYFLIDWTTDCILVKFILNAVCNNYKSIWKGWDTDIYQYRWWDQRHGEWYRVAVCDSWGSGNLLPLLLCSIIKVKKQCF